MLREVSNLIFKRLIGLYPPDRPYPKSSFEREPMPWLVSHFLVQTMQRSVDLEIEELRAACSDWFDYDHPEVQSAFKALTQALSTHTRIPRDEWADKLERAIFEVTSYLFQPTHTLVDFVFQDESGPLPIRVIYRRMAYFGVYSYLREVLKAYAEQKNLHEIDRSRFASVLTRSDRRMTSDYTPEDWIRLLNPAFEFMRTVQVFPETGVPIDLLCIFFENKGAGTIVSRLRELQQRENLHVLDESGLKRLLEKPLEPEVEKPVARPLPPVQEPVRPAAPVPPASPAPETQAAVPLWQQFRQKTSSGQTVAAADRAKTPPVKPAPAPKGSPEPQKVPLWMQFRKQSEPAVVGDPGLAALEREVLGEPGIQNRDVFIRNLFGGNKAAYETVLKSLHEAHSWAEASKIVAEEVFKKYQVNIYGETAVAFTDAVEKRFRRV